jgi:NADH-quinone oxidoreductase subunit N
MSAAITLFGLSLLYGFCGSLELSAVASAVHAKGMDSLLVAGMVMTVIGFGFKVAVAPFHFWAPDVYTGAPTLVAGFIASVSKVASFYVLTRILVVGFAGAEGSAAWRHGSVGWVALLAILAALSMVLGNLGAIVQSQVKRLLAYSAIAHAGYMLLAVIACGASGGQPSCLDSLIYYAITYAITTIGAFGVVSVVEDRTGGSSLADFAGLSKRSPILALCMMVFLLSLAGIPPLAGFFGKFFVFVSILDAGGSELGLLWLIILGIATSAISLFYYLQVLKQTHVMPGKPEDPPIETPPLCQLGLILLTLLTVILGIFPELVLKSLRDLH